MVDIVADDGNVGVMPGSAPGEALVSVIVPVYNTERYLRQCLESIVGQTHRALEVIIVDDGSTDGSPDIEREFAEADGRVRILTQENRFAGAARNNGMAQAHGDYLLFLDSDDWFEPEMVERMVASARENGSDVVICRSSHYDDQTGEVSPIGYAVQHLDTVDERRVFSGADMAPKLFQFCVGWPWDKLFRASFVRGLGLEFQDQRSTNDAFFVFLALAHAGTISIVDEPLAFHRKNNAESVSNTRNRSFGCAYEAMKAIRARLEADGIYERFERSFINWQVHFSMWNYDSLTGEARDALVELIAGEISEQVRSWERPQGFFYTGEIDAFTKVAAHQDPYAPPPAAEPAPEPEPQPVVVSFPDDGGRSDGLLSSLRRLLRK